MSIPHTCRCGICGADMRPFPVDISGLRPCECVGGICVQQTTPHMMLSNTFCKMPRASTIEAATERAEFANNGEMLP